jgi:predicted metal-dependent hydrolase
MTEVSKEFEEAYDQIMDQYTDLESSGEDWVADTLKEVEDDVILREELEQYIGKDGNETLQHVYFSELINDEKRKSILETWAGCFEDLTEEELTIDLLRY